MSDFILNLSYVKCPMNLILVKKAFYEKKFENGGTIVIQEQTAIINISKYLQVKKIAFTIMENQILIH
jgi:hypothetical protein